MPRERNDADPSLYVPRRGVQRYMGDEDPEAWCPTPQVRNYKCNFYLSLAIACVFVYNCVEDLHQSSWKR